MPLVTSLHLWMCQIATLRSGPLAIAVASRVSKRWHTVPSHSPQKTKKNNLQNHCILFLLTLSHPFRLAAVRLEEAPARCSSSWKHEGRVRRSVALVSGGPRPCLGFGLRARYHPTEFHWRVREGAQRGALLRAAGRQGHEGHGRQSGSLHPICGRDLASVWRITFFFLHWYH